MFFDMFCKSILKTDGALGEAVSGIRGLADGIRRHGAYASARTSYATFRTQSAARVLAGHQRVILTDFFKTLKINACLRSSAVRFSL
jgi:hypothetical protein